MTGDAVWQNNKKLAESKFRPVRQVISARTRNSLNIQYLPFPKWSPLRALASSRELKTCQDISEPFTADDVLNGIIIMWLFVRCYNAALNG